MKKIALTAFVFCAVLASAQTTNSNKKNDLNSKKSEANEKSSSLFLRDSADSGKTQPLIFLDGVEITEAQMKALDSNIIESVNVTSGKSATAIYGERGVVGVIIITTKKETAVVVDSAAVM